MIFWRKMVIFHTKYPNNFRASLPAHFFLSAPSPNLKSWIRPCKPQEYPGLLRLHVDRKIDLIKKKEDLFDCVCNINTVQVVVEVFLTIYKRFR